MRLRCEVKHLGTIFLFLLIASTSTHASDWPGWRGPDHNGTTPDTDLPGTVDAQQDQRWKTAMPGSSSATPVVAAGRVFVVSNNEDDTKVYGICLDAASGEVLWQKLLDEQAVPTSRNTMASCSPVTDGALVYFMSGTGPLYAYDMDGKEIWSKNLTDDYGHIDPQFGYSSSPLLHNGRLFFPILRGQWENGLGRPTYTQKDSHVVCLDAATGAEVWKVHRPSSANGESFDSYASAVPYTAGNANAIIVQGGDSLTAHDAATGEELWRQEHNPKKQGHWRLIPSPIVAGKIVIGMDPRGGGAFSVLPGQGKNIAYEDSNWIYEGRTADVPTPAYYEGKVFVVNGTRKKVICLDPSSGEALWEGELDSSARIWSSPTMGDGKLYCLDERGQLIIAQVTGGFKVLCHAEFGGAVAKSSVALAEGSLFIRTGDALYRVGG